MVYSMASFFTTQYACRGMFTYFLPYVDHATVVERLRWWEISVYVRGRVSFTTITGNKKTNKHTIN